MQELRALGYWKSDDNLTWPHPICFVDLSQDPTLQAKVVEYLKKGECWVACAGFSFCRLCGTPNGSYNQTDGYYEWPSGLAHYLEVHHVRLPDAFVNHVCSEPIARTLPDDLAEIAYDVSWWKSQRGWHDGSQVELVPFRSYYDSVGALSLTAVTQPVTAAQLKFVRRFADFSFFSTLALRETLRSGEPLLLQHEFHAAEVPELTEEARALGLTLTHRRYTSREEYLQHIR
ncbi:hypothetical protein [Armatimonas rosea]|uniref:Uncharacterized protein n=1 Tax=Armatimonas rosea TaxID=685828 RepID=A0A7W9SR11_ARMRO|nr:hypothetical protein [Armatimonas rosea]MBB6050633.1 hypothetical protein [Armatimonas rosea]